MERIEHTSQPVDEQPAKTKGAIRQWLSHVREHNSLTTHKLYCIVIQQLERFLPQETKDITLKHLEQFLASLNGLKPNSYNAYVTAVKVFGTWLEEHDLPNPTKKLKKKRVLNIAKVLTDEEYDKVLAVCNQQERDIVQLLCCSGLRQSEFLNLSAASISENKDFLYIIGKGGKARSVPTNNVIRNIISRHPDLNFSMSEVRLRRLCHKLAQRAGIKRFTAHWLRHTFCTRLLRLNVPIFQVSKTLGHSSVVTTQKYYAHFVQQDLAGLCDVLDK